MLPTIQSLPPFFARFPRWLLAVPLILAVQANAQTAPAAATPGGNWGSLVLMLLMFGVLWFLMVRPQMKRAKEHRLLLDALKEGDEVIIQNGIVGKVAALKDSYVRVEIAANTTVLVQKPAITVILPSGTLKSL